MLGPHLLGGAVIPDARHAQFLEDAVVYVEVCSHRPKPTPCRWRSDAILLRRRPNHSRARPGRSLRQASLPL